MSIWARRVDPVECANELANLVQVHSHCMLPSAMAMVRAAGLDTDPDAVRQRLDVTLYSLVLVAARKEHGNHKKLPEFERALRGSLISHFQDEIGPEATLKAAHNFVAQTAFFEERMTGGPRALAEVAAAFGTGVTGRNRLPDDARASAAAMAATFLGDAFKYLCKIRF